MNEFDKEQNNDYSASQNGSYYTPPKNESEQNNSTYHYSYRDAGNPQNNNRGTYYNPGGSADNYQQYKDAEAYGTVKPAKKSNAAKVIIIILVICLFVAIAGIVLAALGYTTVKDSDKEDTSQSQKVDENSQAKIEAGDNIPEKDSAGNYTVAGVYKNNVDSCVGITVYSQQASSYNYFYGYGQNNGGSDNSSPTQSGEGSGILMSEANGKTYVMTCAHVISDGDSFKVTLNDGTECEAKMVGVDAQTDIGVLSINKTGLKIAKFADSEKLVVGEQVVAIGCPGGLEFMNSQTSGYISALDRPVSSTIGYNNKCIQVDAAINPGNSGGALFNMQGQVIGVNSSKIAATEYEGMGFAVPSSTAVSTANSLIKVGYVEGRAKLGITYNVITNFNNSNAIINALAEKGYKDAKGTMVINSIDDSSNLSGKDIKQYDMIVAVNGKTMTSTDIMTSVLADSKPGDTVKLTIARIDDNEIKIKEIECKLIESKG